jgi:hypothetical protein
VPDENHRCCRATLGGGARLAERDRPTAGHRVYEKDADRHITTVATLGQPR